MADEVGEVNEKCNIEGSISESKMSLFRRDAIGRFLRVRCANTQNNIPPTIIKASIGPRIANVNLIT